MIHVIATIRVVPGQREQFLAHFRELMPEVRAEAGCLEYGAAVDLATPVEGPPVRDDVVTVLEKWADVASLQAHLAAPHMQQYREKVQGLVTAVEIRVLQPT